MNPCARLTHQDYTVGWICALSSELIAAMAILDERHSPLAQHPADHNTYILGRVGEHNVVLACLPAGQTGTNSAATVAAQMRYSFGGIRFWLMVGIGGGVPSTECDIRLGDVVVSKPGLQNGGVVCYDFGKTMAEGRFVHTGSLNSPPTVLLTALNSLQAEHAFGRSQIAAYLEAMNLRLQPNWRPKFAYQGAEHDQLYEAEYEHVGADASCEQCDVRRLIVRHERDSLDPVVHYGTIASGNRVMKHGGTRDRLRREFDVLCFEMEAAGLMNDFPCVVIRGVSDYADSHKNKGWQEYAAATAAAYAKELLNIIPTDRLTDSLTPAEATVSTGFSQDDEEVKKVVLGMLYFPRMNSRHEEVSETHGKTFSWILYSDTSYAYGEPDLAMNHQYTRAGFVSWLREGTGVYWINGKAGSGKSTLMKLIRGDPQTLKHLEYWAGDIPLVIGHFYFHDRGSQLEKSQVGLFRALLHQIFTACPFLIPQAFGPLWGRLLNLRTSNRPIEEEFSRTELLAALKSVLRMTVSPIRLCFFIDGLDEYEGSDREIAGFLTELVNIHSQESRWHKICVSSRPHAAFEAAFSKGPTLKLQDLTYNDIYIYVYSQLGSHSRYAQVMDHDFVSRFNTIVKNVVRQACGVFLWVRLAVVSLLNGLDQYDWIHELEERVKALPPEFEAFYNRMLRMIDKRYRHQAARIFRIMLEYKYSVNCAILSFVESNDFDIFEYPCEAFSLEQLNSRSILMGQRIKSKCGGLIELHGGPRWTDSRLIFFHQTVREYFQQAAPWDILLEGISVPWCDTIYFGLVSDYCFQCAQWYYNRSSDFCPALIIKPDWLLENDSLREATHRAQIHHVTILNRRS